MIHGTVESIGYLIRVDHNWSQVQSLLEIPLLQKLFCTSSSFIANFAFFMIRQNSMDVCACSLLFYLPVCALSIM